MAQEYSLAHLTVLGCPTPEMVYIAARAGYDFVSPRLIYMGLPGEPNYALADNPEMLRQTKRALADTGLRVHDIELARVCDDMHATKESMNRSQSKNRKNSLSKQSTKELRKGNSGASSARKNP